VRTRRHSNSIRTTLQRYYAVHEIFVYNLKFGTLKTRSCNDTRTYYIIIITRIRISSDTPHIFRCVIRTYIWLIYSFRFVVETRFHGNTNMLRRKSNDIVPSDQRAIWQNHNSSSVTFRPKLQCPSPISKIGTRIVHVFFEIVIFVTSCIQKTVHSNKDETIVFGEKTTAKGLRTRNTRIKSDVYVYALGRFFGDDS